MSRKAFKITLVGLGYVGLPSALALHGCGHTIHGIDVSSQVIDSLKQGKSHLKDQTTNYEIPIDSDRWSLSLVYDEKITESDIVIVTVPTPIKDTNEPDISFVESAFDQIMPLVQKKSEKILVLESTVYPGVTRRVVNNAANKANLEEGIDYHIAYCPERIDPGVSNRHITDITRVIGCGNIATAEKLVDIYSDISEEAIHCGSLEVAEAAKLIENVQRDVDIALANEMAIVLSGMGLDSEEVFSAAETKWNFHRHKPGIGVGGHCIAVDPYYYLDIFGLQNKLKTSLVTISRGNNNLMPEISAKLLVRDLELKQGDTVLLLGYAYKQNLGDSRNTPVRQLTQQLQNSGIKCEIFDPLCNPNLKNTIWHVDYSTLRSDYNAIVVSTPHDIFDLSPEALEMFVRDKKIFDGRRAINPNLYIGNGWRYSSVGYDGQLQVD